MGVVSERIDVLLADVARTVDAPTSEFVELLQSGHEGPLRVAICGRVKAGKSTLVNALIGRSVAPTSAGECTRVPTWYVYGAPERIEVLLVSGETVVRPFDPVTLVDLGFPDESIDRVTVSLQEASLRELTLIDTPGLSTTSDDLERSTRRAMFSTNPVFAPEGIIYVFRDEQRADDVAFLREYARSSGAVGLLAAVAIGVLSHADQFGAGVWVEDDPLAGSRAHAAQIATARSAELATVVAVATKIAETSRTGRLREADARSLAGWSLLSAMELELALMGTGPHSSTDMARLRDLLGDFGVRYGRNDAAQGALALRSWIESVNGLTFLETAVASHFLARQELVRAARVIRALEARAYQNESGAKLRLLIAEARADAVLQRLSLAEVWARLAESDPESALLGELRRVALSPSATAALGLEPGATLLEIRDHALTLAGVAQELAYRLPRALEREAARELARAYSAFVLAEEPSDV